jgi:ApaG protein
MTKESYRKTKYSVNDKGSVALTEGFRVVVNPLPINPDTFNSDTKYLFEYNITIINESDKWAKLLSRKWLIIDAEGNEERVEGPGVVGYSPEFKPGDTFSYSSYCPLDTPWGTMEGSFKMVKENGDVFEIHIDRFYLVDADDEVLV